MVLVGNHSADDGDQTPGMVRALAEFHSRINAVTRIKTGMMGWDMKKVFGATTGKTLAVINGNGQMPCEDGVRVYRKLLLTNTLISLKHIK